MILRSVGLLTVTMLFAIVAVPLFGRTAAGGGSSQEHALGRPTPTPTVRARVLVHAIDDPILHHTAIRLRPHDPADVLCSASGQISGPPLRAQPSLRGSGAVA